MPTDKPDQGERGGRAVAHTIVNKIAMLLINAGTGILTARALMPAGRGDLAALTLWPVFLSYVMTLGIPRSVIYVLRREPQAMPEIISTALTISTILGSAAAFGGALLLPLFLAHQYDLTTIRDAQWFLVMTPILAVANTARVVLEARGLFSASNRIQIIIPATALAALLLLLALHRLTPLTAGLAYMAGVVPSLVVTFVRIGPIVERSFRVSLSAARTLLTYGIRSYGIDLLGTLSLQVDQVLVISLLPATAMGTYGVMLSLSRMFNLFQSSVVMVLFPKATGQSTERILELTERSARISTMITASCCLVASIFGVTILRLLYGATYATDARCLRLLLVEVTISGAVFIFAQAFMAMGHPGAVTLLQTVGLSLSLPLMLWLIPLMGIDGAALALLMSTLARFVFVCLGFRYILKVRIPQLLPDVGDMRLLATAFRNATSRAA